MIVRILIDTCVVRRTLHQYPAPLLDLGAISHRKNEYKVSIAATAYAEILAQFVEGRIPANDWNARISDIDSLLDPNWPVFLHGGKLAYVTGAQTEYPIELDRESCYSKAIWKLLRDAVRPSDITHKKVVYRDADGAVRACQTDAKRLSDAMNERRKQWINYIEDMRKLATSEGWRRPTEDFILEKMTSRRGKEPNDPVDLNAKLDAVSRMIASFVCLAINNPDYNPSSDKRRGETFDVDQLFAIALPAVIVTADEPFWSRIRKSNAPHAKQVCLIDEFNEHVRNGTLSTLVDDFQTPERQQIQRCEAAYFRWQSRGCPISDDWADWFESEPLA